MYLFKQIYTCKCHNHPWTYFPEENLGCSRKSINESLLSCPIPHNGAIIHGIEDEIGWWVDQDEASEEHQKYQVHEK